MSDWIALAAQWLEPVYKHMHCELLAGDYLQADETPIRCNDPDEKRGSTPQGWLWVISRSWADVVFDWRLSRRYGELMSLIDGYRGVLQSDCFEAYANFTHTHDGVGWVGCWAHARRYFFEALGEKSKAVHRVLRLIDRLYRFESEWESAGVGAERAALRREHFARQLRWSRRIALGLRSQALPRTTLGEVCAYLLAH